MFTKIKLWFIGDAVALDELGNAILLNGDAHETISAHCGAQLEANEACLFCKTVCRILSAFFPRHCQNAWRDEKPMLVKAVGLPGEKNDI